MGLKSQAAFCTENSHSNGGSETSAGAYKCKKASGHHAASSAQAAQPDGVPEAAAGARSGRCISTADAAASAEGGQGHGASMPAGCLGAQGAKADESRRTAGISRSTDCHKAAQAGVNKGRRAPRSPTCSQAAALAIASADRSDAGRAVNTRMRSRRHKLKQC